MVSIQDQNYNTLSHNETSFSNDDFRSTDLRKNTKYQRYIIEFCHKNAPLWNKVPINVLYKCITFNELDGGLSNQQYQISIPSVILQEHAQTIYFEGKDMSRIVYHAFVGESTKYRIMEHKVLQKLRESNVSTTFISECEMGRISYFQQGGTQSIEEFRDPAHAYAIAMRQAQQNTIEMDKEPTYTYAFNTFEAATWILASSWYERILHVPHIARVISEKRPLSYAQFTPLNTLESLHSLPDRALQLQLPCLGSWKDAYRYMSHPVDTIERMKDSSKPMKRLTIDDEILVLYLLDIETLLNEVYALCNLYSKVFKIPLLFSHNDCHGRNVIYEPDADTVNGKHKHILIDFEYTFYNFRGFDLANAALESATKYVSEYPGFEIDYSAQQQLFQGETLEELMPCERAWIEGYIEGYRRTLQECENPASQFYTPGAKCTADLPEVSVLIREIRLCMQQSHQQWIFWALKTAQNRPEINFGYIEYALVRKLYYIYYKEKVLGDIHHQLNEAMAKLQN